MIQKSCCGLPNKLKVMNNSNQFVEPQKTKVERAVNTILFSSGGRTQYGNRTTTRITFLGRTEGQSGGIIGAIKNRF